MGECGTLISGTVRLGQRGHPFEPWEYSSMGDYHVLQTVNVVLGIHACILGIRLNTAAHVTAQILWE